MLMTTTMMMMSVLAVAVVVELFAVVSYVDRHVDVDQSEMVEQLALAESDWPADDL